MALHKSEETIEVHFYVTQSIYYKLKKITLGKSYYDFFMTKIIDLYQTDFYEDEKNLLEELKEIEKITKQVRNINMELKKLSIENYIFLIKNYLLIVEELISDYEKKYLNGIYGQRKTRNIKFRVLDTDLEIIKKICDKNNINRTELFISCIIGKRYRREETFLIKKEIMIIKKIYNLFLRRLNFFETEKEFYEECFAIKNRVYKKLSHLQKNI